MSDRKTEVSVFESFGRVAGPGGEGEGAARSNDLPDDGRERRSEADIFERQRILRNEQDFRRVLSHGA
jgi:hypothetical protein